MSVLDQGVSQIGVDLGRVGFQLHGQLKFLNPFRQPSRFAQGDAQRSVGQAVAGHQSDGFPIKVNRLIRVPLCKLIISKVGVGDKIIFRHVDGMLEKRSGVLPITGLPPGKSRAEHHHHRGRTGHGDDLITPGFRQCPGAQLKEMNSPMDGT